VTIHCPSRARVTLLGHIALHSLALLPLNRAPAEICVLPKFVPTILTLPLAYGQRLFPTLRYKTYLGLWPHRDFFNRQSPTVACSQPHFPQNVCVASRRSVPASLTHSRVYNWCFSSAHNIAIVEWNFCKSCACYQPGTAFG
jgi:hypothetical protein